MAFSLDLNDNGRLHLFMGLSFITYNLHGYNPRKRSYLAYLVNMYDIVCVQEHWLYKESVGRFLTDLGCCGHCVCAVDSSVLRTGRPYGGVAIIWKKDKVMNYEVIETQSKRLCVLKVTLNKTVLFIFNVYMPCDTGQLNLEVTSVLNEISSIIAMYGAQNIVMSGDWNSNLRSQGSPQTEVLRNFVHDEGLIYCIEQLQNCIDFTYESMSNDTRSLIDHHLVSEGLKNSIGSYEVLHDIENLSDHAPVALKLRLTNVRVINNGAQNSCKRRLNWQGVSSLDLLNYQSVMENLCTCNTVQNGLTVSQQYDFIENSCLVAGLHCIPMIKRNRKRVHRWNEVVKEKRQTALFWHKLWNENGRPSSGIIFDIRKSTRKIYHLAVKQIFKENSHCQALEVADSLCRKDTLSFWNQIRRIKNVKPQIPNVVDGKSESDIVHVFAEKYKTLYSSVSYDPEWEVQFETKLEDLILNHSQPELHCDTKHCIEVDDVVCQAKCMKRNKSDVNPDLNSNHIINGGKGLWVKLAAMFTLMLSTGIVPIKMCMSTLVPIPKDLKRSLSDSNNYRSIAIGSVILKLLELIILKFNSSVFETSNLQFGFKQKHSTTQCCLLLQETIAYYGKRGSKVYVAMLDCSKAFDRVSFKSLFNLLIDKNMCPFMLRLLWRIYKASKLYVRWQTWYSSLFDMLNGVKQGGIVSPKLFTLYIDKLFKILKNSGLGCYLNNEFVGILGYADDLAIVASSKEQLEEMLKMCKIFADEHCLIFNAKKSQYMVFGDQSVLDEECLLFDGESIAPTDRAKYLGHVLVAPYGNVDIHQILSEYCTKVNAICDTFKCLSYTVKYELSLLLARSLFGCELVKISDSAVDKINVVWRKSTRKMLNIAYRSHSTYIPLLVDDFGLLESILCKIAGLYRNCLNSRNPKIQTVISNCCSNSGSVFSENLSYLCSKVRCDKKSIVDLRKILVHEKLLSVSVALSDQEYSKINFALEVLDERDKFKNCLTKKECGIILEYLLTS